MNVNDPTGMRTAVSREAGSGSGILTVLRDWAGNPGWNACIERSRGSGGKSEAVRDVIFEKIKHQMKTYVDTEPDNRHERILPICKSLLNGQRTKSVDDLSRRARK